MSRGYLLDTSVLNSVQPTAAGKLSAVEAWFIANHYRCYLSTVVVAEVVAGIARLRRDGGTRRADRYDAWLQSVVDDFGDRVVPLDVDVGRRTGELFDHALSKGRNPGFADIAIAATASVHGLTVLTRNVADFAELGVALVDPFKKLPL